MCLVFFFIYDLHVIVYFFPFDGNLTKSQQCVSDYFLHFTNKIYHIILLRPYFPFQHVSLFTHLFPFSFCRVAFRSKCLTQSHGPSWPRLSTPSSLLLAGCPCRQKTSTTLRQNYLVGVPLIENKY